MADTAKHSAWVISWEWFSEPRKPRRLLLHLLPAAWSISRVVQHMKYLYVNSEFVPPLQRVPLLPEGNWNGLLFKQGPRIIIGDDPWLLGCKVDDLRIERVDSGRQIVRWTQPAGLGFKPGSSMEPEKIGNAVDRALEVSDGEISEPGR